MPVYTRRQQHFDRAKSELGLTLVEWRKKWDLSTPEFIEALLDRVQWTNSREVRRVQARITAKASRAAENGGEDE